MIFTRFHKHSSCKSHLEIQNLCWRMIREAVLVCVISSVGTRSPRTTIQPAFLLYEAENGFHHGPWEHNIYLVGQKTPWNYDPGGLDFDVPGLWNLLILSDVVHKVICMNVGLLYPEL